MTRNSTSDSQNNPLLSSNSEVSAFSSHAPRRIPEDATEILELESEYPYCAIPPHFFERRLLALAKGDKGKGGLVLEITRR